MAIEKHFINKGLQRAFLDDYLSKRLKQAGYVGLKIQKTAIGVNITLFAERTGMVIGREGRNVRELEREIKEKFGIEEPNISASRVDVPELSPRIMAFRLAHAIKSGIHFRRAAQFTLRRIMEAGARGAEIRVKGKLTSRRARYEKYILGSVAKAGQPAREAVEEAVEEVPLKPGILGIKVKIMLPKKTPDDITITPPEEVLEEVQETEEQTEEA